MAFRRCIMLTLKPPETLTYSCLATIRRHFSGRLETELFYLTQLYDWKRYHIFDLFEFLNWFLNLSFLVNYSHFHQHAALTHDSFLFVMQVFAHGSNWTKAALLREPSQSLCVLPNNSTTPLIARKEVKPLIQMFGTYLDFIKTSSKEKFLN